MHTTTRRLHHYLLGIVLCATLLSAVLPIAEVSARRPVCTTSKKVRIARDVTMWKDADIRLWVRACVQDGVVVVEARQQNIGYETRIEPIVEAEIRVTVHGTSSRGRFLKDIKFDKTEWLGDLTSRFSLGAGTYSGNHMYGPSARVMELKLPEMSAGTYYLGIELRVDSSVDAESWKSTGVRYLKFKVQ
jgi:hypothetical protein